jgi:hypothetical protein
MLAMLAHMRKQTWSKFWRTRLTRELIGTAQGTNFKRTRLLGEHIVSTIGSCDNKLLVHSAYTLKIPLKDNALYAC